MNKYTYADISDYTVVFANSRAEAYAIARTKLCGRIKLISWH